MKTKAVQLAWKTPPEWVRSILDDFDSFLADHAECERKASAMALALADQCAGRPDVVKPLIDLALEELTHFRQVYALMQKRGVPLAGRFLHDPYAVGLLKLCRHGVRERLLDRMLVFALIEARGTERFRILTAALKDPALKKFYRSLMMAEARHGNLFVTLACKLFDSKTVNDRLAVLVAEEAKLIAALPWRPSVH